MHLARDASFHSILLVSGRLFPSRLPSLHFAVFLLAAQNPKLRQLINLKNEIIKQTATPPMYLKCDLKTYDLTDLGASFDVILIDPPWEEYVTRCPGATNLDKTTWSCDELAQLKVGAIAENPSFLFIWVGSAEGLDHGRALMSAWGFRRCEDICWLKTNKQGSVSGLECVL